MYAFYRCSECKNRQEYKKPYGEEFPEKLLRVCSSQHDSDAICEYERSFESKIPVYVAEGVDATGGYNSASITPHHLTRNGKQLSPFQDNGRM